MQDHVSKAESSGFTLQLLEAEDADYVPAETTNVVTACNFNAIQSFNRSNRLLMSVTKALQMIDMSSAISLIASSFQ